MVLAASQEADHDPQELDRLLSSGGCWRYPQRALPGVWRGAARCLTPDTAILTSQPFRTPALPPTATAVPTGAPTAARAEAAAPTATTTQNPDAASTSGNVGAAYLAVVLWCRRRPGRADPAGHRRARRHRAVRQAGGRRHRQAQHLQRLSWAGVRQHHQPRRGRGHRRAAPDPRAPNVCALWTSPSAARRRPVTKPAASWPWPRRRQAA